MHGVAEGMSSSSSILAECAEVYALAKKFEAQSDKSVHWNVFPADFALGFEHADAWPKLLRNGITAGFNDDTMAVPDRWERRRGHDYGDLVPRHETNKEVVERAGQLFRFCVEKWNLSSVKQLRNTETGSPRLAEFEVKVKYDTEIRKETVAASVHDLSLVYACGRIVQAVRGSETILGRFRANPTFVEIGGGFGELSAKVKLTSPKTRCVIFDLPEPGAVQLYYLQNRCPGRTVYTIKDFHRLGLKVFDEPFDFLLLPPAFIKLMPTGWPAIYINMRSFQEMQWLSVADYFVEIQRSMLPGGLFCCINRVSKQIGDQHINYDRFPFDNRWKPLSVAPVPFQRHIREGIFERM